MYVSHNFLSDTPDEKGPLFYVPPRTGSVERVSFPSDPSGRKYMEIRSIN